MKAQKFRKIISLVMAVCIVFTLFAVVPFSASAEVTSGTTGDCSWTLDGTHLTISGNGEMGNYDIYIRGGLAPWGTEITSVDIKQGVTNIGDSAFRGCTGLTSVIIGNGVTRIGDSAFYGCTSLTGITIPDSVANIGWGAFSGCTSLTSITIPDSVTSIGDWAFGNTAYYDNDNNWLDGVLYISNHLIGVKKDIVKGDYVIRQGTKSVNGNAFSGCEELTSVTIPDSVINIGYDAFHYCAKLTAIIVDENNRNYCSADGVLYTKDKSQLMLCPTKKRV